MDGICHICGRFGQLSFEHVPPEKAFNNVRAQIYAMNDYLKASGLENLRGGTISQRGIGSYTLCIRCNNNTGAWYGPEYAKWAGTAAQILSKYPNFTHDRVTVLACYPLRLLKQAVAMLCSINAADFAAARPDLVRFVLNKENRAFPEYLHAQIGLYRGQISRRIGFVGVGNVVTHTTRLLSEIAHPPLVLLFSLGCDPLPSLQLIDWFRQYRYDQKADVMVEFGVCDGYTPYPSDYRSRDQVLADAAIERSR
jgi:hypothetical protein